MENLDFARYLKKKQLCIKPFDDGFNEKEGEDGLGLFDNCLVPSTKTNRCNELYNEFYSGKGRFYVYDIKLCHTKRRIDYKKFLKEFIDRGKQYPCVVHLSNSTVQNEFNNLTSLYDINYFSVFLGALLTIEKDLVVEISDKRTGPRPDYDMFKVDNIYNMLIEEENVKHFMLREEVYTRRIKKMGKYLDVKFLDDYEKLHYEIVRYNSE